MTPYLKPGRYPFSKAPSYYGIHSFNFGKVFIHKLDLHPTQDVIVTNEGVCLGIPEPKTVGIPGGDCYWVGGRSNGYQKLPDFTEATFSKPSCLVSRLNFQEVTIF